MRLADSKWFTGSLSAIFLLALGVPAFGQQMNPQQQGQQQQISPQMQQQPQQQQAGQGQQQGQQRQQQAMQGQTPQQQAIIALDLEPVNRIAVAYDFDDDGQIDALDYVNPNLPPVVFLDRQQANVQAGRQQQQNRQPAQFRQTTQQMAATGMDRRFQGAYKVQGTVQDIRKAKLSGSDERQVFALVQTEKGKKVAVDLGPQWKVNQLNLKKGDQITAFGRLGRVDQRPVLSAFNVRTGDKRISVPARQEQMAQSEKFADRYNVTIINSRTINLPGGPSVVMSKVRLQDGSTTLVNMGPSSELRNINLQQNQNIRLLARPASIAGQNALIAERIAVGNQQVDIDWNQVRADQARGASAG